MNSRIIKPLILVAALILGGLFQVHRDLAVTVEYLPDYVVSVNPLNDVFSRRGAEIALASGTKPSASPADIKLEPRQQAALVACVNGAQAGAR